MLRQISLMLLHSKNLKLTSSLLMVYTRKRTIANAYFVILLHICIQVVPTSFIRGIFLLGFRHPARASKSCFIRGFHDHLMEVLLL
jgi:hypothetical protein